MYRKIYEQSTHSPWGDVNPVQASHKWLVDSLYFNMDI